MPSEVEGLRSAKWARTVSVGFAIDIEGLLGAVHSVSSSGQFGASVEELHDPAITRELSLIAQIDELDHFDGRGIARALGQGGSLAQLVH